MKATADLGDVYLARGDAERAEPLLRSAITQPSRLFTNSPAPVLGGIYANLGQLDESLELQAVGRPLGAGDRFRLGDDDGRVGGRRPRRGPARARGECGTDGGVERARRAAR